ncbi:MAG TPA: hypothetical protein VK473_02480, partial [Terriglobales bacterium]|nr:hypothetical protein [Terriglobales bacterium]
SHAPGARSCCSSQRQEEESLVPRVSHSSIQHWGAVQPVAVEPSAGSGPVGVGSSAISPAPLESLYSLRI